MLDRIPEDLLRNVLDRLTLRDTARMTCVSSDWREAIVCVLDSISLVLDTQRPDKADRMLYWLAALSARPRACHQLQLLQLHPFTPADRVLTEPVLVLPGEVAASLFGLGDWLHKWNLQFQAIWLKLDRLKTVNLDPRGLI